MKTKKRVQSRNKSRKKRGGWWYSLPMTNDAEEVPVNAIPIEMPNPGNIHATNIRPFNNAQVTVEPRGLSSRYNKVYDKIMEKGELIKEISELLNNEEELKRRSNIKGISVDEFKDNLNIIMRGLEYDYARYYRRLYKEGIMSHRNGYPTEYKKDKQMSHRNSYPNTVTQPKP
jgi:hypothetical protein